MAKRLFILILLSAVAQTQFSFCCTIIMSDDSENVYVGNNEDFLNDRISRIWFIPAVKNKYGSAFWGFSYGIFKAEWIPQGGMNEHGLFFDRTAVPEQELEVVKGKKNADPFFLNRILQKCKTVDEAVKLLETYNLKFFSKGQILLADKSGDYAIIENNSITRKTEDYVVVTNFRISNPRLGGFPSKEYSSAQKMLEYNAEASISNFENILNEIHKVDKEVSTIYSQICDLKTGVINLYQFHDFEHRYKFDLMEELGKGKNTYLMADLFPERVAPEILDLYYSHGLDYALSRLDSLNNDNYCFSESELFFVADLLFDHNLYTQTVQVCDTILNYYPDSDETLFLKGKCMIYMNDVDLSMEYIRRAAEINPFNYTANRVLDQLSSPQENGNTRFELKGYQDARLVTIVMSYEKWEDLNHIMHRKGDSWEYACDLKPGSYEYIYIVDGHYVIDPGVSMLKQYPTATVMVFNKE